MALSKVRRMKEIVSLIGCKVVVQVSTGPNMAGYLNGVDDFGIFIGNIFIPWGRVITLWENKAA